MELLKPLDNVEFKIDDITFYIRPQMTVRDKFEMDIIGDYADGKFTIKKGELLYKLVELFVTGWSGVTENGKPVPYSYETFMNRLPASMASDYVVRLSTFIVEKLNIVELKPEKAEEKNA